MRKQDAAWFVALASAGLSAVALVRRRRMLGATLTLGAAGAGVASRRWSRDDRRPFPYSLRWILAFPHPISAARLRRDIEPAPGDRVLEIGPGTGRHAVQIAQSIGPDRDARCVRRPAGHARRDHAARRRAPRYEHRFRPRPSR